MPGPKRGYLNSSIRLRIFVEFFRVPAPGKRDPHFGLSRGWYYKAEARGEIKMVALRQRGAVRGVRLIVYDSVSDYIRRAAAQDLTAGQTGL